jgi:hypothetical protein
MCTMALVMSAQNSTLIGLPELKVGLTGSFELPVLINRSGRNIIGYVLLINDDTRVLGARMILHIGRLAREPLESVHVLHFGEDGLIAAAPSTTSNKVSLDAVVFSDGEFAGPDTAHLFDVISMRVDATREFALQALDNIGRIETMARSFLSRFKARIGRPHEEIQEAEAQDRAAQELYRIQRSDGIGPARQAAERLSKLPKLWRVWPPGSRAPLLHDFV